MSLLVLFDVVVELLRLHVVVEFLHIVEFGLPFFILLVIPLLAYVIQYMYHNAHSLKMNMFYGQIQIDRVLFDRLTYPFECLSICFKKIRKCEE